MVFNKLKVATAAAVIGLSAASAASALTLGDIPGGIAVNNGLQPVYGSGAPVQGYYGAQLYLLGGPADVTVEYFGNEAGFQNQFDFDTTDATVEFTGVGSANSWNTTGAGSVLFSNVGSGLLDFAFTTPSGAIANGANPDGAVLNTANWFVTFKPSTGETATSGTIVDLWLDDNGAGPDDNHDDLMIRLTVDGGTIGIVPVPASIPLLLSGLAGFGIFARRRKA